MRFFILLVYAAALAFLAFIPEQKDFFHIIIAYALAFSGYLYLTVKPRIDVKLMIGSSLFLNAALIFSFPNLSDDIYRFIWDGLLLHQGINPYAFTPDQLIANLNEFKLSPGVDAQLIELYPSLNSKSYYSVYPPVIQFFFFISTIGFKGNPMISVFILKSIFFLGQCIVIFVSREIIRYLQINENRLGLFILNPLIILELTGNIHFEGIMLVFFVAAIWFLIKEKNVYSAIFLGISIAVKLLPLIFLPFFLFNWHWRKSLPYLAITGLFAALLLFPLVWNFPEFGSSLELYFQRFEFNAGIYYLFRTIGTWIVGYNLIAYIGPVLAVAAFLLINYTSLKISVHPYYFFRYALLSITIYLICSTTVHPWYLSLGLFLSLFTDTRYFIFWSGLVMLSYARYSPVPGLYYVGVGMEYLLLALIIWFERGKIYDWFDSGYKAA